MPLSVTGKLILRLNVESLVVDGGVPKLVGRPWGRLVSTISGRCHGEVANYTGRPSSGGRPAMANFTAGWRAG